MPLGSTFPPPSLIRTRVARGVAWRLDALRQRLYEVTPYLLPVVRELRSVTGRGWHDLTRDVVAAWWRTGCDPETFAALQIWLVPRARWSDFILGGEFARFLTETLDPADRVLSRDKAAFAAFDRARGVPWLPTLAVVDRGCGVDIEGAIPVRSRGKLWPVLDELASERALVLKPACGRRGDGFFRVGTNGIVHDGRRTVLSRDAVTDAVFGYRHRHGRFGYVVQPALSSHPDMVALTGIRVLATVRVATAVSNGHVHIVESFLKVPGPMSLIDNFRDGSTGTMVSGFDPETGILTDLVGLLTPGHRFVLESTPVHRRTGCQLAGKRFPRAADVIEVARRAALAHPNSASMGWDIAIASDGLFVLDGNPDWGPPWQPQSAEGPRLLLSRLFPRYFRAPAL